MTKKSLLILFSFLLIIALLIILAISWGNRFDWPDNVHIDYGFPLTWSTQTLSTIIGPVNLWTVDVTALILNLTIWLTIMLITTTILLYLLNKKPSAKEKE
ncbi:hypothetical protein MUO66_04470 [Candidatus Bathyarchaeota archaeon]|nr:hypothetical protein [Candidatus Bathyarchaeota archaeon]